MFRILSNRTSPNRIPRSSITGNIFRPLLAITFTISPKDISGETVRKSRSITRERYVGATEPNQIVVDYIASMTDSYFMALYAHLFPERATRVQLRGYCADLH